MDVVFTKKLVPFRRIENLAIAHLGSQRIFFNESATAIWELLDGRRTVDDVAHALVDTLSPPPPLSQVAASVHQLLNGLARLNLIEPVTPNGEARVDVAQAMAPSESPTANQDACATPRRSVGAFSIRATTGDDRNTPRRIEDRFNDLYWDKCYIQKMHLELTYRCNFRCIQCYNTTHAATDRELTVAEWRGVIEQLAALGCHSATFTGGEVFVRKDAVEILDAACDQTFSFRINTNGSLITEALLQKLEPMRPFIQSFDVSFYGATPHIHDTLARRLGAYDATLRAVQLLAEARMPLLVKFVTMRDNFDGIAKWKADMRALGVRHTVAVGTLIPRTDRNTAPLAQLLTDDQYRQLLVAEPVPEGSGAHFCRPGHIRGAITPDGSVSPCEWLTDFKFGRLKEQSLRDIWYSDASAAFRGVFEQESECPPCELRPGCSRCPAHSYLETGNLLKCAPSPRHFAEIYRQSRPVQPGTAS